MAQVASGHHKEVPGWAIAVIVLGTMALIALAVILGVVIYRCAGRQACACTVASDCRNIQLSLAG